MRSPFLRAEPQREHPTATHPSPQEIPMSSGRRRPQRPKIGSSEAKRPAENLPKNALFLSDSLWIWILNVNCPFSLRRQRLYTQK